MTKKQIIIGIYSLISLIYAIWQTAFAGSMHGNFFFNLGKGIFWPVIIFPALGNFIGGIIMIVFAVAILLFWKKR